MTDNKDFKAKFIDLDFTVNGYDKRKIGTYGSADAYGGVTFIVEIDGIEKRLCMKMGSSKGKVTPEEKRAQLIQLRNYLLEQKETYLQSGIISCILVKKTRDGYDVSENDPVYQEVYKILNGNR